MRMRLSRVYITAPQAPSTPNDFADPGGVVFTRSLFRVIYWRWFACWELFRAKLIFRFVGQTGNMRFYLFQCGYC